MHAPSLGPLFGIRNGQSRLRAIGAAFKRLFLCTCVIHTVVEVLAWATVIVWALVVTR